MGPPSITANLPLIKTTAGHIERVNSTKLLGIHLDSNFSWQPHIEAILQWLRQLNDCTSWNNNACRSPSFPVTTFLLDSLRPFLEYASPVWHHLITKKQSDQIEAIQKRAIRIIYRCAQDMPYASAIFLTDLPTMSDRRDQLARKFFKSTIHPTSSLHNLLPPPREHPSITRLRVPSVFIVFCVCFSLFTLYNFVKPLAITFNKRLYLFP